MKSIEREAAIFPEYEEVKVSKKQNLSFQEVHKHFAKEGLNFDQDILPLLLRNGHYSNLALWLSDQNPFQTEMILFDKQGDIIAKEVIGGDVLSQMTAAYDYLEGAIDIGDSFSQASRARKHASYSYPLKAVREILLNAYIHRDYSNPLPIQFLCYPDKMTVISPGGLVPPVCLEDILGRLVIERNPVLADLLSHLHLNLGFGTGLAITLNLYQSLNQAGKVSIDVSDTAFSVTLPGINI